MKITEVAQRLDPKCWTGYHKAGTKIKGGKRVNNCVKNESQEQEHSVNDFVKQFAPWVAEQLGIKLPKIELLDTPIDTTFGMYDPNSRSIKLVTGGRHPVDVLRTLAHELTHHRQDLEDNLPPGAGETGTDQENEANSEAGIMMRDFAQENPEYFGLDKEVDEGWKDVAAAGAMAGAMALGAPTDAAAKSQPHVAPTHQTHKVQQHVDPKSTKVQDLTTVKAVDPRAAVTLLANHAMKSGISSPIELAQFLAQCSAETGYFKHMGEIGRPSNLAHKYSHSTGNAGSKDALKFVGRGFVQLTGKGNYMDAGKDLHGDANYYLKNPNLAADTAEAAKIAVWFWKKNVQPRVKDFADTTSVTKAINGLAAPQSEIQKRHQIFADYIPTVKSYVAGRKA